MNVVIEYPENFALHGVERSRFEHCVQVIVEVEGVYDIDELDALRSQTGQCSTVASYERFELQLLLDMSREAMADETRAVFLKKLSAYLGVRLRQAEDVKEPDDEGAVEVMPSTNETQTPDPLHVAQQARRDEDARNRRWVIGLTVLVAIVGLGVLYAVVSSPAEPVVPDLPMVRGGPHVASEVLEAAADEPAEPVVDISLVTSRPARKLADLVKVMPASGQTYSVTVRVIPMDKVGLAKGGASQ